MLVRLKAPAEQASGAQGQELVYFPWRGVQVARSWRKPDNPQTSYQVAVRTNLSDLTKAWSALSSSNRQSWDDYAADNLIVDRLGRQVKSTALGVYVAFNSMLLLSGQSAIDTAPTGTGPSPVTGCTIMASGVKTKIWLALTHGYSTLTGLKVVLRLNGPYLTPSLKADPRKMHLCGLAAVNSFVALGATGSTHKWETNRDDVDDSEWIIAAISIMDTAGRLSVPYTGNLQQVLA